MQELGRMMTLDVLENFVPQDLCALFPNGWYGLRRFAFIQCSVEDCYGCLRFLVMIGHHAYSMETKGIREDERAALLHAREKRREHRPIQGQKFVSNGLWRGVFFKGSVEHKVVIGHMPGHAQ